MNEIFLKTSLAAKLIETGLIFCIVYNCRMASKSNVLGSTEIVYPVSTLRINRTIGFLLDPEYCPTPVINGIGGSGLGS